MLPFLTKVALTKNDTPFTCLWKGYDTPQGHDPGKGPGGLTPAERPKGCINPVLKLQCLRFRIT